MAAARRAKKTGSCHALPPVPRPRRRHPSRPIHDADFPPHGRAPFAGFPGGLLLSSRRGSWPRPGIWRRHSMGRAPSRRLLLDARPESRIRSGKYDAVLCFVGYVRATFWMALLAAKLSKSAFLFGTDTTTLAPRDGRAWKAAFKKILWPRLFRLADQVLVPSSGSRAVMLSLGIPGDRVTLTPYSVDNDWWMQQASQVHRSAVRGAWGAGPDTTVVLFCAKLQPWKRPADLLRAFARTNISDALLLF